MSSTRITVHRTGHPEKQASTQVEGRWRTERLGGEVLAIGSWKRYNGLDLTRPLTVAREMANHKIQKACGCA